MKGNERVEIVQRRAKTIEDQERKKLRDQHGHRYAALVSTALDVPLDIDDFSTSLQPSSEFVWPRALEDAPGLVASYISRDSAARLLDCFQNKVGPVDGLIGFHDKPYLGLAEVRSVHWQALLAAAAAAEDSVVLYTTDSNSAVLVDCYRSQPAEPFSIVVQGERLIDPLKGCYGLISRR